MSSTPRAVGVLAEQVRDLHDCLALVRTSYGTKPSFRASPRAHLLTAARALGAPVWQALDDMVASVCRSVLQTVPTFWRIARNHAEGKAGTGRGDARSGAGATSTYSARAIYTQSRSWAVESIQQFIRQIRHVFEQEPFGARVDQAMFARPPAWVPEPTCSLSTTHYMSSILGTLANTVQELEALAVPGTAAQLQSLLLDTRFQFTEVLCFLWLRDARLCHHLETWVPNTQQPSITSYLFTLSVFNRWNAREGFYMAGARSKADPSSAGVETAIYAACCRRLKLAFVDALHAFLDGIVSAAIASGEAHDAVPHMRQAPDDTPRVPDRDTRILMSVSNLSHLRHHVVAAWMKQFQDAYHVSLADEQKQILDACAKHDHDLLQDYVQRQGDAVTHIIHAGILESGVPWDTLPNPHGVNAFIYQALLRLVQVHAQVRATVPSLASRVISALVEMMANAALYAYSRVPQFNMGGMLQATLEIEFVHQTMAHHVTPHAEATLKLVYETISQRYSASAANASAQTGALQQELENVKRTLVASRKATALEFLCFRRPKGSDKDAGRSGGGGSRRGKT
ncbi:Exocyst complex component S5 [Malassezia sp. CBS 17886]|nr:Exocyst complex component S5 [Malassezia sp. CBS 17886]